MFLLVTYLLIALGFSFLCSIAEAVLLSMTPSYIALVEQEGRPVGKLMQRLKENVDRPLAAILSLNTIAHTVGAAGVGAQAAAEFGSRYVGVTSAVLTLLILVLSEIIPKTLGASYWRELAPAVARLVQFLIWAMLPLVWLSEFVTRLLARGESSPVVTREEFAALASVGAEEGHLESEESIVLGNLLKLRTLKVRNIMTPRTVVFSLDQSLTVGQVFAEHAELPVSRIPIYNGDRDDVTGVVLKDDILVAAARDEHTRLLTEFKRDVQAIPASANLAQLYVMMLKQGALLALVLDEYGGLAGVVTLEDLIETILGLEIVDESDQAVDMQELAIAQSRQRQDQFSDSDGDANKGDASKGGTTQPGSSEKDDPS